MVCERCQKKESTVHLTEIIKSVRSEVHLCEECAREIGFNSKISDLTSFIFSNQRESDIRKLVCPLCGTDAYEVTESSHMGCPVCYQVFASAVSVLSGDHYYAGKKPDNTGVAFNIHDIKNEYVKRDESVSLDSLKRSLDEAIKDERYEDAAVIRDLIKEKEGSFRV